MGSTHWPRHGGYLQGLLLGLLAALPLVAQQEAPRDSLWKVELPQVVVTATKGARTLSDVPVPTQVITGEDAAAQGALRLSDLLAEQAGLTLVYDHGAGLQVQGFDADYTLILIDGEPVIGRTAGTLDLERLTVADVERVEVVRGPSSSLYGSEALAGVVNIITRRPAASFKGHAAARYQTHDTVDLTASADLRHERLGARLLFNRYSSGGYDLDPDVVGPTLPGFTDYTTSARLTFEQSDATRWDLSGRLARQRQRSLVGLGQGAAVVAYNNEADRVDWSVAPGLTHRLSKALKLTGRLYASGFRTDTAIRDREAATAVDASAFDQHYAKAEAQLDAILGTRHLSSFGGGYIAEAVTADRVNGGRRTSSNLYGFVQHEWLPNARLDLIASARLDVHSEYAARFSPKLAVLYKPGAAVRVRASVGSGFKAPTFQERYLDFTNAVNGYSVFGATDAASQLGELEALGLIRSYLAGFEGAATLRPESSVSFNLGFEAEPSEWFNVRLNLFRNNVHDLIEVLPIAIKTNGQNVFTYANLNRIFTQGAEVEAIVRPHGNLTASVGYQYLDARDRDVVDALAAGSLYKRVDGRDRRVRRDEYGGLFNRSRHTANVRVRYRNPAWGLTATLRGHYRGRYGFGDLNGNLVLDDASEYVGAYMLWNATVTQQAGASLSIQAGVKNLLGKTNTERIPSLPGRLLFVGLSLDVEQR